MHHFAHPITGNQVRKETRQPLNPFRLPISRINQVLPDFDQRMGKPGLRTVPVQRVALQKAAIGFIVSDHHTRLLTERLHQRHSKSRILVPQDARVPPPLLSPPGGRIAVD